MTYSKFVRLIIVALVFVLCFYSTVFAQISKGGIPPSMQPTNNQRMANQVLKTRPVKSLDMDKIIAEDQKMVGTVRFAAPIAVDFDPLRHGEWTELANGDRIWRLKIQSSRALGLYALYDEFFMPVGAKLFMYDGGGQQIKGAYTSRNNKKSGKFMTGMVKGDVAVIEYFEPVAAKNKGRLHLYKIMVAYEHDKMIPPATGFNNYSSDGFGDALGCHVNIHCPEGEGWEDQARGTVRINRVFEEGIGWCSGSLMNNTLENAHPYVLSAFHCIAGYTPIYALWRTDFHFESSDCSTPTSEPEFRSILGLSIVASRLESDFILFELSTTIPNFFDVYFNGWSRSTTTPNSSMLIHHPRGDLKKLSKDNNPAFIHNSSVTWNDSVSTPPSSHFRLQMDVGTVEAGSSGSPMFDPNKRIVGQLHGGNASCSAFNVYHGRFNWSWGQGTTPETRLSDWLDPLGISPLTLNGFDPGSGNAVYAVSGNIKTITDLEVPDVEVFLYVNSSTAMQQVVSDTAGVYDFSQLSLNNIYTIVPKKEGLITNGVTTFDAVLIRKHILNITPFDTPEELIAADINNSGTITTLDLVFLTKVILSISDEFPNNTSWRMHPAFLDITNLNAILNGQDFRAVKIGDVNGSADPGM